MGREVIQNPVSISKTIFPSAYFSIICSFSWSPFKLYDVLFDAILFALYHRFKAVSLVKAKMGGCSIRISSDGDDERIFFSAFKFAIPGFFWIGRFSKYFFGWLDLRMDFLGVFRTI